MRTQTSTPRARYATKNDIMHAARNSAKDLQHDDAREAFRQQVRESVKAITALDNPLPWRPETSLSYRKRN